eukprot:COSAG01_NODE_26706_length_705_cov_1.679868_2_plen_57_part_01
MHAAESRGGCMHMHAAESRGGCMHAAESADQKKKIIRFFQLRLNLSVGRPLLHFFKY